MCLDVGGDPAVRQSLDSNDTRSSTSFVPTGRAIPVLSVPTRPSRVVLCRQRAGVASNIIRGKTNLRRASAKNLPRGETFTTPRVDVTLSTRASVMAPFRKPRAQSSAVCLLLGAVAAVLGIIGLVAHHTHQQAASHHDVIHHFHSSSSRLDVGSDTPVKLGGGNRAGRVSQHPKADRFRSHVRARVDAHKNADGDNLDDLRSADETIRSSIPVKTIREDANISLGLDR